MFDNDHRFLGFSRRRFLGGAMSLCASGIGGSLFGPRAARAQNNALPDRGDYLVRNAFVMTLDEAQGDIAGGDVHVQNGSIVAVGRGLAAAGAEIIDGTDMIVLPGLVETHWHVWTTMLRSMSGDVEQHGYFPTSRGIGAFYTSADMYHSGRLALAEALNSGITFVHDWCHNVRSPEHARQALRAIDETGIRARFGYGSATGQSNDEPLDMIDVGRLADDWDRYADGGRVGLGLAWRGLASEASMRDYTAARELGLPISVHVNNTKARVGGIAAIAKAGLLGPHMQLIHAIWSAPEEIRAVADSAASISLSPFTELRIGFGFPMTGEYLDAGVNIGLSIDTPTLSGNADMFAIMKAIQNVENAKNLNEFKLPARRVLELATITGAKSMGIGDRVGSLVPGKRADLIMLNTRAVNLGVFTDPAHMIVEAAQPSNVDTVIVDGRMLKRGGRLTHIDTDEVIDSARVALAAVRKRANWQ